MKLNHFFETVGIVQQTLKFIYKPVTGLHLVGMLGKLSDCQVKADSLCWYLNSVKTVENSTIGPKNDQLLLVKVKVIVTYVNKSTL